MLLACLITLSFPIPHTMTSFPSILQESTIDQQISDIQPETTSTQLGSTTIPKLFGRSFLSISPRTSQHLVTSSGTPHSLSPILGSGSRLELDRTLCTRLTRRERPKTCSLPAARSPTSTSERTELGIYIGSKASYSSSLNFSISTTTVVERTLAFESTGVLLSRWGRCVSSAAFGVIERASFGWGTPISRVIMVSSSNRAGIMARRGWVFIQ